MSLAARKWVRIAGPGAVIVTIAVIAGMALWLPGCMAGIGNLVLPLVLMSLIWAALFFHACLDRRLGRVAVVALGLLALDAGLVAHTFLDRPSAQNEAQP